MGDVSKIKMPDNSIQNVKDKVARETIETKMPFYTIGTPTVLVDTTTVSFSKDGDNNWYISGENPISLSVSSSDVENSIFLIEWDNVEYRLFLKTINEIKPVRGVTGAGYFDWWAIGNISTIGYGSTLADIEAPFAVTVDYMKNAGERYIISYDTAASHTIKISKASFTKTVCDPAYYADTRYTGYPPIRFTSNFGSVAESGASKSSGLFSHAEGIGTTASGKYGHAEGNITTASGTASHAEGQSSIASGYPSHAEGYITTASGTCSHTEGYNTRASAESSHAEGSSTTASGYCTHAEGNRTTASGSCSHAEGQDTTASGNISHVEGEYTIANHRYQHVFGKANIEDPSTAAANIIGNYVEIVGNGTWETIEGETVITRSNARTLDWNGNEVLAGDLTYNGNTSLTTTISNINTNLSNKMDKTNPTGTGSFSLNRKANTTVGTNSFAEGNNTEASGNYSHAEGFGTKAINFYAHSEGRDTTADGLGAHAEGYNTTANGDSSHAEGFGTTANSIGSHAEGYNTTASNSSHSEGYATNASGYYSHAEGVETTASAYQSHAEGRNTTASGDYSHTEGYNTRASAESSHAEGSGTTASGKYTHAEGLGTTASGNGYGAHAEGYNTRATGNYSHSAGYDSTASGAGSTATGRSTIANHRSQYVFGEYNAEDTNTAASNKPGDYIEIVGNGTATNVRSNARTLDWSGNEVLSGSLTCTSVTQTSSREVKKNIELMSEEEAKKILKLEAVSFDFKDEKLGSNKRGFIAEDVKEILPNLVIDKTTTNPMSLDYISIIPYLQYIIKKQDERITELEKILKEKL